jgi:hypothetical protein
VSDRHQPGAAVQRAVHIFALRPQASPVRMHTIRAPVAAEPGERAICRPSGGEGAVAAVPELLDE